MTGFMEISQEEMYAIDGGGWFKSFCTAVLPPVGFIGGGVATAILFSPWYALAGGSLGAAVGLIIADLVPESM